MILYKCKIPFFEQYKVDPQVPWPWDSDKEQYTKLKRRAFKSMVFNYLVVSHFNIVPIIYYYNWQIPWNWKTEIPPAAEIA